MSRLKSAVAASLVLLPLCTGSCGRRRSPEAVTRELVETAEELAGLLESAETLEDLQAREDLLVRIVRRAPRIRTDARRAGKAPPQVASAYQARWDEAIRRIIAVRVSWMKAGRKEMLQFLDGLK